MITGLSVSKVLEAEREAGREEGREEGLEITARALLTVGCCDQAIVDRMSEDGRVSAEKATQILTCVKKALQANHPMGDCPLEEL